MASARLVSVLCFAARLIKDPGVVALVPLAAMVSAGLTLALWCAARHCVKDPQVALSKARRRSVPELEQPEATCREGFDYAEHSMLRHLGTRRPFVQTWREWFFIPSMLPGDPDEESAAESTVVLTGNRCCTECYM
eukprot:SM000792S22542  [mRNA]  locus=s792:107:1002:+ [translate_table: standard]